MEVEDRARLLDPVDRISEVLFGLIMAVTIVGSLSIGTAGRDDVHAVTMAALACNIAWGLVDAVMYVVRTVTQRTHDRALGVRIRSAGPDAGRRLIAAALPEPVAAIAGTEELEGMRLRLLAIRTDERPVLGPRDILEALGVFALVVVATFPVAAPFLLVQDAAVALNLSRAITLAMLFGAGVELGRHGGHPRPLVTGVAMAVFGAALIGAVKALGG